MATLSSRVQPDDRFLDLPTRTLRVHVRDWGGRGPAVVLLHGLASSSRIWDLTAPRLAGAFRVVALDQRGHGLSEVPDGSYGFEEFTGDLETVLRTLTIERPVVVGHSWGANVALQYAAEHPDDVAGLVLVDGSISSISESMSWEKAQEVMRPPEIDGTPVDVLLGYARKWPGLGDIWSRQIEEIFLATMRVREGKAYRRLPIEKHMRIVRAMYDQRVAELYTALACPVLLVPAMKEPASERERVCMESKRKGVEAAQRSLPRTEVLWMEDTIHDVPLQRPEELAGAIVRFAEGLREG